MVQRKKMNVHLAVGNAPLLYKLNLSSKQKYFREELFDRLNKNPAIQKWILLDNVRVPLQGDQQIDLACQLAVIYHNSICFRESDTDSSYSESVLEKESEFFDEEEAEEENQEEVS